MKDLTEGSIARHLLSMAAFIAIGLGFQAAYFLVDLYFVSALGAETIAGVSAAGNTSFLVMAASQLVGVGVTALIAQAAGRRDMEDARLIFNQAAGMSAFAACVTLILGYALTGPLVHAITADAGSAVAGAAYLRAYLPALAAMFPATALIAALRGAGIVQPAMMVQVGSLALNALLAPILVAGWFTHLPLGAAGAGLASSIANLGGLVWLSLIFTRSQKDMAVRTTLLMPQWRAWWRIIGIGLPVSGEFAMMFLVTSIIYWATRHYGAAAQAGYGIGSRIMTSIFLPAMAISFAVSPVAGQNMGAGRHDRVRATVMTAGLISAGLMLLLSVLCHWRPGVLIALFTTDPAVTRVAAGFLAVISWNFVAAGLIFVCSGLFQALGNTVPSFISSASRLLTYGVPAIFMAGRPGMSLTSFWYLSVASTTVQAFISLMFARREMRLRLRAAAQPAPDGPPATVNAA